MRSEGGELILFPGWQPAGDQWPLEEEMLNDLSAAVDVVGEEGRLVPTWKARRGDGSSFTLRTDWESVDDIADYQRFVRSVFRLYDVQSFTLSTEAIVESDSFRVAPSAAANANAIAVIGVDASGACYCSVEMSRVGKAVECSQSGSGGRIDGDYMDLLPKPTDPPVDQETAKRIKKMFAASAVSNG